MKRALYHSSLMMSNIVDYHPSLAKPSGGEKFLDGCLGCWYSLRRFRKNRLQRLEKMEHFLVLIRAHGGLRWQLLVFVRLFLRRMIYVAIRQGGRGVFNRPRQTFVRLNNKLMILLFGLLYKMARSRLIFTVLLWALTDVPAQLWMQQVIHLTPNGTLQLLGMCTIQ